MSESRIGLGLWNRAGRGVWRAIGEGVFSVAVKILAWEVLHPWDNHLQKQKLCGRAGLSL